MTEDGQPVDGASVNCASAERSASSRQTITDAEGNFTFTGLGPTVYSLFTYAPGFVINNQFGGDGRLARIGETHTLTLVKGGVVTGRVTNTAGEPVVGVQVGALRLRDGEGKPVRSSTSIRSRMTDDRGIYRLYGLPSGTYLIVANPSTGAGFQSTAYDQQVPTFFPSSNRDGATEISVQEGAEVSGIDIRYRDIRGHAISGTVEGGGASGAIDLGAQLELRSAGTVVSTGSAFVREAGGPRVFTINGVSDGDYDLIARGIVTQGESQISAPRRVTVRGADVVGIKLIVAPMASVAGKFVVETGSTPPDCARGREATLTETVVRAYPDRKSHEMDGFDMPVFRRIDAVEATGVFTLLNLNPGPHYLGADLPSDNWYLKSATMPGPTPARKNIDLGRTALTLKAGEKVAGVTVTAAEGAALLSGKITGERVGRGRWRVHLVPMDAAQADNTLVYYESAVGSDGSFILEHLAPGKYWAVVRPWPEDQPVEGMVRRAAWDAAERTKLRKEAEAAKQELELKACQRVKDAELSLM